MQLTIYKLQVHDSRKHWLFQLARREHWGGGGNVILEIIIMISYLYENKNGSTSGEQDVSTIFHLAEHNTQVSINLVLYQKGLYIHIILISLP